LLRRDRRWGQPGVRRPSSRQYRTVMAQAGIRHPVVGAAPGTKYPVTRANGAAGRFARIGGRMVFPAGGDPMWGWGSRRTGFGVPAAGPLIIPSRIGGARTGGGVTPNQQRRRRPSTGARSGGVREKHRAGYRGGSSAGGSCPCGRG